MNETLARVFWQMGQPLLPDHFTAQEEALLSDTEMRFRMGGLPHYGIGTLEWRTSLLNDGVLSISKLSMITPMGVFLALPGNAKVVSPLNLNSLGTTKASVYCHLFEPEEQEDDGTDIDESEAGFFPRRIYRLHISADPGMPGSIETLKIAELAKDLEDSWRISSDYIPPLLLVGSSPFLRRTLDQLALQLEIFQGNLTQEIAASYLSGESLFMAKNCLERVYELQRFLLNLEGQIDIHPYFLYEELLRFYSAVCTYHNTIPDNLALLYRHDSLGECFKYIVEPLLAELRSNKTKAPYIPFEITNGRYEVKLSREVREASAIYLLVQKPNIQAKIVMDELKLAGPSRIPVVHKLSLPGIPMRKIDRPPFQHSFGSEVEFYELVAGEEWDHALRELSLAFYEPHGFEGMKPYLYWRIG